MSLVSISRKRRDNASSVSPLRRFLVMIVIDKFFALGAVFGFLGSIGIGVYIWLVRAGYTGVTEQFVASRALHATMQFYLFLVPFILGFLIQSGSKLLEININFPKWVSLSLPCALISGISLIFNPESLIASLLMFFVCWLIGFALLNLTMKASWAARLRFGSFAVLGLFSLGLGAFIDLSNTIYAVSLFWFGIVSIILATAQQFIVGVIGGDRPGIKLSLAYFTTFIFTGIFLLMVAAGSSSAAPLAAIFAVLTMIIFIYSTKAWRALSSLKESLPLAFTLAHIWAVIGSLLVFQLPHSADAVIHLWGIGYAVTLIIGISLRLVAWITDTPPVNNALLIIMLVSWQVVTFVRGFYVLLPIPNQLVLASSIIAGIVLTVWIYALLSRIYVMFRSKMAST